MAVIASRWLFEQLESPFQAISLSGAQAPHGRPRQKPVVSDGLELREQAIRYSGNDIPSRHIFGSKYEDLDLIGRWRDANIGEQGAQALAEQFQQFLKDGAKIRISWGDVLSYEGYLKKFIPHRESPWDIAWEMKFVVDKAAFGESFTVAKPSSPTKRVVDINEALKNTEIVPEKFHQPGIHISLGTDFVDTLSDLVSNVNAYVGSLADVASELSNLEQGTAAQLARLRAGLHQAKTALLILQDTINSGAQQAIFQYRTAASDVTWLSDSLTFDRSAQRALALMQEFDRECEIAQRSNASTAYVARLGDSWESISNRFFAGPEGANAIRQMNGVKYGDLPVPGRTYSIPKSI